VPEALDGARPVFLSLVGAENFEIDRELHAVMWVVEPEACDDVALKLRPSMEA
jgi:hypothetical protein